MWYGTHVDINVNLSTLKLKYLHRFRIFNVYDNNNDNIQKIAFDFFLWKNKMPKSPGGI